MPGGPEKATGWASALRYANRPAIENYRAHGFFEAFGSEQALSSLLIVDRDVLLLDFVPQTLSWLFLPSCGMSGSGRRRVYFCCSLTPSIPSCDSYVFLAAASVVGSSWSRISRLEPSHLDPSQSLAALASFSNLRRRRQQCLRSELRS